MINFNFNIKYFIFILLILSLYYILVIILSVAFLTLFERKVLAAIQKRKGPNVVGFLGLLQAFADAFKLILKENITPQSSNIFLFFLGPFLMLVFSIASWFISPFSIYSIISDINIGMLYIFMVSSLNVLNIILAGWASNPRYAFLGALRSIAQIIAYEVVIGIIIINTLIFSSSTNLLKIILAQKNGIWFGFVLWIQVILFFIAMLAETNRHPFDLAEAESELVSGYNVEHSSILFALFSLSEYANILLLAHINIIIFWGGWLPLNLKNFFPFFFNNNNNLYTIIDIFNNNPLINILIYNIKILIILFLFIWVRATLPRYRYDQLMRLGWKVYVPLTIGLLLISIGLLAIFNAYSKVFYI